jgi:shikimate dehydrogenase
VDRRQPELSGRRCAVLGAPIAHSLSPALHRAAYAHLGLDWRYDAVEVTEPELPAFVAGLDPTWRGLSLTMPLKPAAASVAGRADPLVRVVGAANTLVRSDDGSWSASNTDVPGIVAALAEVGVTRVASATVLGGGSTAASAVAALAGVSPHVVACVRSPARTAGLQRVASVVGVALQVVAWDDAAAHLSAPLVLATTPAGAADPLAAAVPHPPGTLLDVVYDPWPTALAQAWAAAGGTVRSGMDLLVHQAVLQVRLMTGQDVPVEVLRSAGERALAARGHGTGGAA